MSKIAYSKYIESAANDGTLLIPKHVWAATLDNPNQEGIYLSEKEFNRLQSKLTSDTNLEECTSREDAREKLEEKASNMGIIEYFVLRALIAWLIESILDSLFGSQE